MSARHSISKIIRTEQKRDVPAQNNVPHTSSRITQLPNQPSQKSPIRAMKSHASTDVSFSVTVPDVTVCSGAVTSCSHSEGIPARLQITRHKHIRPTTTTQARKEHAQTADAELHYTQSNEARKTCDVQRALAHSASQPGRQDQLTISPPRPHSRH